MIRDPHEEHDSDSRSFARVVGCFGNRTAASGGAKFQTVNGVAAKGGSICAGGPSIANGMVFTGSGYVGFQNGVPGNVLLAFAPQF